MSENKEMLELIREQTTRLLSAKAEPSRLKEILENPGSFDREIWSEIVDLGWTLAALPEDLGGLGLGWQSLSILAETSGRYTASIPVAQNVLIVEMLSRLNNRDHQDFIDKLMDGSNIGCVAFAEPGSATHVAVSNCQYANGTVVGLKSFTPFAAIADVALVSADSDEGEMLLFVDLNQKEVKRDTTNLLDNARGASRLEFDNASASVLATGSKATKEVLGCLARLALVSAFEQVGGAQVCLEMACDYARERQVFGQPIGQFQAVKHKLADIYTANEIARGCALDGLAALMSEASLERQLVLAAAARLGATKAYDFAARESLQTFGGIGITWEADIHLHYRRARSLALELYSTFFWENILVENLALLDGAAE